MFVNQAAPVQQAQAVPPQQQVPAPPQDVGTKERIDKTVNYLLKCGRGPQFEQVLREKQQHNPVL